MGWTRARRPEQKQQRRMDLLAAAAELFRERGFDGVPLSEIAAAAGMSKAAVYRYFDSKEQIFLEILAEDYRAWTTRLEQALAPLAGSNDPDAVAALTDAGNDVVEGKSDAIARMLERLGLPPVVCVLGQVGEETGQLDVTMEDAAGFLEYEMETKMSAALARLAAGLKE